MSSDLVYTAIGYMVMAACCAISTMVATYRQHKKIQLISAIGVVWFVFQLCRLLWTSPSPLQGYIKPLVTLITLGVGGLGLFYYLILIRTPESMTRRDWVRMVGFIMILVWPLSYMAHGGHTW